MDKRKFCKTFFIAGSALALSPTLLQSCKLDETEGTNTDDNKTAENDTKSNPTFELPSLSFEYAALVPFIDEDTMMIHHSKHHQGYVNKLNKALESEDYQYDSLDDLISQEGISQDVINNGGGHKNHSFFWKSLNPAMVQMSDTMKSKIDASFGSIESFEQEFIKQGKSIFGSGWLWLVDNNGKLEFAQTENQDNPWMSHVDITGNPILNIDVWEHAYYLEYQNERGRYLENIMYVIDWKIVEERLV